MGTRPERLLHQGGRDAGFGRGAGSRRDHDGVGGERGGLGSRQAVVADDERLGFEFGEVARDVEDEGIVIVDDQDHAAASLDAVSKAAKMRRDLGQGLVIFCSGVRQQRDAAAGMDARLAVAEHDRSDRDVGVHRAVEAEIADRPAIDAARHPLDLGDDLHGAQLRGAGDRAARKRRRPEDRARPCRARVRPSQRRRGDARRRRIRARTGPARRPNADDIPGRGRCAGDRRS